MNPRCEALSQANMCPYQNLPPLPNQDNLVSNLLFECYYISDPLTVIQREHLSQLGRWYIPGNELSQVYEAEVRIGGGYGTVEVARWQPPHRPPAPVAIKQLQYESASGSSWKEDIRGRVTMACVSRTRSSWACATIPYLEFWQRLIRETEAWTALDEARHPYILPFLGFHLDANLGRAWLVSPYMSTGSLDAYLARHRPGRKRRLELVSP